MRNDLNITLSLLSTTWKELEKTMIDLEDAHDFGTNDRKKAHYITYQIRIAEIEEEMKVIRRELKRLLPSVSDEAEDSTNTSTETKEISKEISDVASLFSIISAKIMHVLQINHCLLKFLSSGR